MISTPASQIQVEANNNLSSNGKSPMFEETKEQLRVEKREDNDPDQEDPILLLL